MFKSDFSSRYYLFSVSNLIAAFGGGLILGKATDVINHPMLHGGSILAFFVGAVLGLIFLQSIPKKNAPLMTQFFSFGCGLVSLSMYCTFSIYATNGLIDGWQSVLFFILLTIRFSFWFFSRVKRASESSGQQQSIAWVEFGYYLGMVLGLVIWDLIGLSISLGAALLMDASFQFIAGILDTKSFSIQTHQIKTDKTAPNPQLSNEIEASSVWCKKMALAVILLTVGVQVVIFHAAHMAPAQITPYLLAVFYLGIACSAFMSNKVNSSLLWNEQNNAIININFRNHSFAINLLPSIMAILISVMGVLLKIQFSGISQVGFFVFMYTFIAAFIYETISLVLLDRIGYEESQSGAQSLIMTTYGLMGVSAAVGFSILISFRDNLSISILLLLSCVGIALASVYKRSTAKASSLNQAA